MDQKRLHQKRHRRQVKRKAAQDKARRRSVAQAKQRERPTNPASPDKVFTQPGLLGRLRGLVGGGTPVTGDQMDTEPARVEAAS